MLSKHSRLTADKDFLQVYKHGKRFTGRALKFFFLPTRKSSRFGFVIAKKSVPLSTGRNRVKRILRAAVSEKRGHIKPGYDVIIQGLPGCKKASPASLRDELWQFFGKAKLLS